MKPEPFVYTDDLVDDMREMQRMKIDSSDDWKINDRIDCNSIAVVGEWQEETHFWRDFVWLWRWGKY